MKAIGAARRGMGPARASRLRAASSRHRAQLGFETRKARPATVPGRREGRPVDAESPRSQRQVGKSDVAKATMW